MFIWFLTLHYQVRPSNTACLSLGGKYCWLNYETKPYHTILVRTTDSGKPALYKDFYLNITLSDINDQPRNPQLSGYTVHESSKAGTLIGVFTANDEDRNQNLTYSLVEDDMGTFRIVGTRLELADSVNYEHRQLHHIIVQVADDGHPSMSVSFATDFFYLATKCLCVCVCTCVSMCMSRCGCACMQVCVRKRMCLRVRLCVSVTRITLQLTLKHDVSENCLSKQPAFNSPFVMSPNYHLRVLLIFSTEVSICAGGLYTCFSINVFPLILTDSEASFITNETNLVAFLPIFLPFCCLQVKRGFTIEVLDVNEAPGTTQFLSLGGQLTFPDGRPKVRENSANGTVVGTIKAFDPDRKQTISFELEDDASGRFGLSSSVSCSPVNDTLVSECAFIPPLNACLRET